MPRLETDDIKDWSLARVNTEIKTRLDDVTAIMERDPDGSIMNAEGDDAGKGLILHHDLGLLQEKHDEMKVLEGGDERVLKMRDYLETPTGETPPQPNGKSGNGHVERKDAGTLIAESSGYEAFMKAGGHGSFVLEVPLHTVFGTKVLGTDDALAGVDDEFAPQSIRLPGVTVPVLFQANNIAPLFLSGTSNQTSVSFMRETVTSQGAAETLEGGTKPEADISFAEDTSPIENVAVTLPVTSKLLEDVAFMQSWVTGRLRLFVLNREDSQLLNGNGVAPNLEGILTVAGTGAGSYSIAAADTAATATVAFDEVFQGMTLIREAFLNPSAVIMAAGTWERFRLTQDLNNNYILGPPGLVSAERLFGLPVTLNENMPAEGAGNEAIAVVAREAAQVVRRNQVTLAVSDSHGTTFAENVLTFRAEQRIGFPIWRPAGITVITSAA